MGALAKIHSSDSGLKMKAEFHKIIKLFEELEEAGESATLTISAKGGTSTIKLQLESPPPLPTTSTTTTPLPPVPGRRRRHRGAAARARRRQRAANHQASLLAASSSASHPASGVASVPAGSQQERPLHILPSPSPSSGRRRVVSRVGRLEVPTFTNLDGAPPSPSPCSPSPSPTGGWPPTKDDVVRYHRMMSKENQCCLCNFRISDPMKVNFVGSLAQCGTTLRSAIQRRRIGLMKPFLQCSWTFDTEAWAFLISTGNLPLCSGFCS